MVDSRWSMVDSRWSIVDGRWSMAMVNSRWSIVDGDGRWSIVNSRWSIVWSDTDGDDQAEAERPVPRGTRRRAVARLERERVRDSEAALCVVPLRRVHQEAFLRRHALTDRFSGG